MQPTCTEDWVKDAVSALREGWSRVDDAVMNPAEDPRPWLFRLAPMICIQRRGLKDTQLVSNLTRVTLQEDGRGIENGPTGHRKLLNQLSPFVLRCERPLRLHRRVRD